MSELLRGLHDFQRRQREHQNNQRKKLDASLTRDEAGANGRAVLEQRTIEADDVCAICQVIDAQKIDMEIALQTALFWGRYNVLIRYFMMLLKTLANE